MDTVTVQS